MTEEKEKEAHADDREKNENKGEGNVNMIPKARLDQEIAKRKASEDALKEVADSLKSTVPEEFQGLIPDLPPQKLVRWIQDANQKGLFEKKTVEALDKKRPGDKQPQDFSNLSPQQMMARGYKT